MPSEWAKQLAQGRASLGQLPDGDHHRLEPTESHCLYYRGTWAQDSTGPWEAGLQPRALSPRTSTFSHLLFQVILPPWLPGPFNLSSEEPVLSLEPHFENWKPFALLKADSTSLSDPLPARFVVWFSQAIWSLSSWEEPRGGSGGTKYRQQNLPQQNFKLLHFSKTWL